MKHLYARWINKNVDFEKLIETIRAFFEKRGLNIEEYHENNRWNLFVKLRHSSRTVEVKIEGSPQNFTIEGLFLDRNQPSCKSQIFSPLFGGGLILLNEIRYRETLANLEKEFTNFLENAVINLTNSGKASEATI